MNIKKLVLSFLFLYLPTNFIKTSEQKKPITVCFFSHGLGGSANQALWYAGFEGIRDGSIVVPRLIPYELFSFNYPEIYNGHNKEKSLGQDNEIAIFDTSFNKMIQE